MTTLDASIFETLSPGWLESLEGDDLAALEVELEEALERRLGVETKSHGEIDARCALDVLYWLQNHTATDNPKHKEQGLPYRAPFPQKSYFVPIFKAFAECKRLFIPKTREMLTSWCVMGDSAHRAQWDRWEIIVQTGSEDKAHELIDYAGQLYKNQPDWLQVLHPLDGLPSKSEIRWASGGRIMAIPSGVHKIRLYHPTRYVMDEAAFLPEAEQCYNAAHPVAQQIIAISSAGPGWFGDQCSR